MENEIPAEIRTVAIIGLGLIGGSMARDLAARGVRVLGWDADGESLRAAVDAGAVHHPLPDDLRGVDQADVVVLAVPVLAAPKVLRRAVRAAPGARLITDAGSTKRSIMRAAEALGIGERFVGSHPLAGDHQSGWAASREGLFAGARVFLSPTHSTEDEAMRTAAALWKMAGAHPEVVDAAEHDRRLAWTSHLPQMVSSALAAALAGQGIARGELGPGGRDVTRLAGSSPDMWADIAIDNAADLSGALQAAEDQLRTLRNAIDSGSHAQLRDLLARCRSWHGG
jgi:prephenate dehydrogenase